MSRSVTHDNLSTGNKFHCPPFCPTLRNPLQPSTCDLLLAHCCQVVSRWRDYGTSLPRRTVSLCSSICLLVLNRRYAERSEIGKTPRTGFPASCGRALSTRTTIRMKSSYGRFSCGKHSVKILHFQNTHARDLVSSPHSHTLDLFL